MPQFWKLWLQMVVVPSQQCLPLFHPWLSGAALAQGPWTQCSKLAPQPAVPERQRWKSSSHSRDVTKTILLLKFWRMGRTCSGINILAGCTTMNFKHSTPCKHNPEKEDTPGKTVQNPQSPSILGQSCASTISQKVPYPTRIVYGTITIWLLVRFLWYHKL